MADSKSNKAFLIGPAAKRELRKLVDLLCISVHPVVLPMLSGVLRAGGERVSSNPCLLYAVLFIVMTKYYDGQVER